MSGLIYAEFVYYLQGLGFRIHNALKGGHDEQAYEEAVVWLLAKDNVPFQRQPIYYVTVSYTHLRAHETKANLVCYV